MTRFLSRVATAVARRLGYVPVAELNAAHERCFAYIDSARRLRDQLRATTTNRDAWVRRFDQEYAENARLRGEVDAARLAAAQAHHDANLLSVPSAHGGRLIQRVVRG